MKLYNKLGLENLKFRLWFNRRCLCFKIKKHGFNFLFYVMCILSVKCTLHLIGKKQDSRQID